mgnify:CR=1 FL=1|tara:strand:- start:4452 stop:4715 length:264 start_codon:yes stop_codon:yes gene_type:complete
MGDRLHCVGFTIMLEVNLSNKQNRITEKMFAQRKTKIEYRHAVQSLILGYGHLLFDTTSTLQYVEHLITKTFFQLCNVHQDKSSGLK